jgi:hypothetical protein
MVEESEWVLVRANDCQCGIRSVPQFYTLNGIPVPFHVSKAGNLSGEQLPLTKNQVQVLHSLIHATGAEPPCADLVE